MRRDTAATWSGQRLASKTTLGFVKVLCVTRRYTEGTHRGLVSQARQPGGDCLEKEIEEGTFSGLHWPGDDVRSQLTITMVYVMCCLVHLSADPEGNIYI